MMDEKEADETISLRIKASKCPDVTITISSPGNTTVTALKESIRSNQALSSATRGRYIRLIYSGRLLAPDTAPLSNFRLKEGSVIHAVIAAAGVRGGHQAALSRPTAANDTRTGASGVGSSNRRRILRGAGIGTDGLVLSRNRNNSDGEDDSDDDDLEEGRARAGFDRLRSEGLSRSEITALRIYFARQIDRFIEQRNALGRNNGVSGNSTNNGNGEGSSSGSGSHNDENNHDDPDESARMERLRMEDEWMAAQGPHSEFRLNLNTSNPLMRRGRYSPSIDPMYAGPLGNDRDFIIGFALGFFMGFIMMLWVWMPTVKHRTKVGILTGICFHMSMNIFGRDSIESE